MDYKPYVERNADGTPRYPRKQRKTERRLTFHHNKKQHSKRVKDAKKQEKLEALLAKQQEVEQEAGTGTEVTA
jgi:hypothetical protein